MCFLLPHLRSTSVENYKFRDVMSCDITRAYLFDIADVEHVDRLASPDPKARLVLTYLVLRN